MQRLAAKVGCVRTNVRHVETACIETPVGPSVPAATAARALGLSLPAVEDLAAAGHVLRVWDTEGQPVYPAWQFNPLLVRADTSEQVHLFAGLPRWRVAAWWATTHRDLDGMAPADWLTSGHDPGQTRTLATDAARHMAERASEHAGHVWVIRHDGVDYGVYADEDSATTDVYALAASGDRDTGKPVDPAAIEFSCVEVLTGPLYAVPEARTTTPDGNDNLVSFISEDAGD